MLPWDFNLNAWWSWGPQLAWEQMPSWACQTGVGAGFAADGFLCLKMEEDGIVGHLWKMRKGGLFQPAQQNHAAS